VANDEGRRGGRADDPWAALRRGVLLLVVVFVGGTLGYLALGLSLLDALYQTVTTVSTVGYRELGHATRAWKIFTLVVIVLGVSTVLYTFGSLLETLVEGRLTDRLGRRRMDRRIQALRGHVIVCGWGRVGRTVAAYVQGGGRDAVVIDTNAERLASVPYAYVEGDATDDAVLRLAGIEHASTLIAALDTDADNLYVTLTGRSLRDDLFIVARARVATAEAKFLQAGANRVVNPQHIGGARMAALALQPAVAEFLDVVMHDGSLEFRLEEVPVPHGSAIAGRTLRDAHIRDQTGALVLAVRDPQGEFLTNPSPDTEIVPGHVLIAIGTEAQLDALSTAAAVAGR
jgi:voltage-gated potassium channel